MKFLKELGIKEINQANSGDNNGWSDTKNQGLLESFNPADNSLIAKAYLGSEGDYQQVVTTAVTAFESWRMVPAPKRGELIRLIGQKLREKKDALGSLVTLETGKTKAEGDGEVQEMIDMADFAVGQSRMLYGKAMPSERENHRLFEQWHPLGAMGVITAFNFPVAVWAWNAFLGAVCGNTIIWKPSSKAPLCAVAVQKICLEVTKGTEFEGVFNLLLPKDRFISGLLADDTRIPLISFTGSTPVGRKIGVQVAERFGKSILELSGNNAIIIDETADLNLAIQAAVFGAVGTAGQRCTTTRRLIIHKSLIDEVGKRLIKAYSQIKIGDPLDKANLLGPLIDEKAIVGFERTIEDIKAEGAEIIYGGRRLNRPGNFVEPTIVLAKPGASFLVRETFAPILYLIEFEDVAEAIAINNASSHGLSSAIFTRDIQNEELFLSSMGSDCGIANVNIGTSGAEIGGAFGGEKETGGGRESGSDAWKGYMRRQTNCINWGKEMPLAQGIAFEVE